MYVLQHMYIHLSVVSVSVCVWTFPTISRAQNRFDFTRCLGTENVRIAKRATACTLLLFCAVAGPCILCCDLCIAESCGSYV